MIPTLITWENNEVLNSGPAEEEIKKVVFALDGNNASSPNGLTGHFYQLCWDIIKEDVVGVVKAFFQGITLPKSMTHTIWFWSQERKGGFLLSFQTLLMKLSQDFYLIGWKLIFLLLSLSVNLALLKEVLLRMFCLPRKLLGIFEKEVEWLIYDRVK